MDIDCTSLNEEREKEGAVWDREENAKHTLRCLWVRPTAPETLQPQL